MPQSDILLYENPYYMGENPGHRKYHRRRRNPNLLGGLKSGFKSVTNTMFGGLNVMEIFGAIAGFALCAMVPGYIIKDPDTQWKKVGKIALAVAFAVAAKALLTRWNPGVARAAMYGGIAGAGALALKIYSPSTNLINRRMMGPQRPLNANPPPRPLPSTPPNMGRSTNDEFIPANQL